MEQRNQGLSPDLLKLLNLMTVRLKQHDQLVAPPPPFQNKWATAARFPRFPKSGF